MLRQNGTEKLVLTGKTNGKRSGGRQRKTFMDNFTELEMVANSLVNGATNRK